MPSTTVLFLWQSFYFPPILSLIKWRLNGLRELLLWKSHFLHITCNYAENMSCIRKLKSVGLEVRFHPHFPSSLIHSFLFSLVLSFLPLIFPWFAFCPYSPYTLILQFVLFFFFHSSNIPQLVWSLTSEEFKDASLLVCFFVVVVVFFSCLFFLFPPFFLVVVF